MTANNTYTYRMNRLKCNRIVEMNAYVAMSLQMHTYLMNSNGLRTSVRSEGSEIVSLYNN